MGDLRGAVRPSRRVPGLVALATAAALAGCTPAEPGSADSPPAGSRYFTMTDGTVAVSDVGRSIEVRWRGADDVWSEPVVAYSGRGRVVTTRTQVAGSTLAMQVLVSRHREGTSVFVACQPGSCEATAGIAGALTDLPVLTPDGSTALLGVTEGRYVVWRDGAGIRQIEPTGFPQTSRPGLPLLAADGSLRVVTGAPTDAGCRFTLHTSEPGAADFAAATTYEATSAGRPRCASDLESFASDYVIVNSGRAEPVFLARDGGSWGRVAADPSGRVRYPAPPRGELAGTVVRTRTPGGHEVLTASPDGHTLVVQLHAPGERRWTAPREIAEAPPGVTCFSIAPTSTPTDAPFYVTLACRSRAAAQTYSFVTAVTEDRERWTAVVSTDWPLRVGDVLLLRGHPAYRWSPGEGLRQVGLPVLDHEEVTLVEDGTWILTGVTASSDGCRLEVRVAQTGATEWSEPIASDLPVLPDDEPCVPPQPQYEGERAYLYFESLGPEFLPGQIRRRNGTWVVEAPRPIG